LTDFSGRTIASKQPILKPGLKPAEYLNGVWARKSWPKTIMTTSCSLCQLELGFLRRTLIGASDRSYRNPVMRLQRLVKVLLF
jgi:hypothetical protein